MQRHPLENREPSARYRSRKEPSQGHCRYRCKKDAASTPRPPPSASLETVWSRNGTALRLTKKWSKVRTPAMAKSKRRTCVTKVNEMLGWERGEGIWRWGEVGSFGERGQNSRCWTKLKLLSYNHYKNDIIRCGILTLSIGGQSQSERVISCGGRSGVDSRRHCGAFLREMLKNARRRCGRRFEFLWADVRIVLRQRKRSFRKNWNMYDLYCYNGNGHFVNIKIINLGTFKRYRLF